MINLFGDTSPSFLTGDGMPKQLEDDRTDVMEELISSLSLPSVPKPFNFLRDPSPSQSLHGISIGDYSSTTTAEEDMKAFITEKYWDFRNVFLKTEFNKL